MSRLCLLGLALLGGLAVTGPGLAVENQRPHIVLVLADDLGAGDLGVYGGDVVKTPQLDRLAREGTRFTQYYTPAPICSPARCGLLTGQFPAGWNLTSFLQERKGNAACEQVDFLDPAAPSLPRMLKDAGYATAHVGKWHLGGGRDVVNPPKFAAYGYDTGVGTYESPEPHPQITATNWIWSDQDPVKRWDRTAFFVDQTLDFVKKHPDQPCFVNLWLDDPHTPWVPQPMEGKTDAKGQTPGKLARVIREMDRQIGRLMDQLPENTLLIFVSDNGPLPTFEARRTVQLRGSKLSLYEGGIRVPFIARWPGQLAAGQVNDTTVLAGVDVVPSLAKLAGAKFPAGYESSGEDLSEALRGKTPERTKPLFWEYGRNDTSFKFPAGRDRSPWLAMREGKWKLLVQPDGSQLELYDLAADPQEQSNLADQQPDVASAMRAKLLAWKASLPKLPKAK
jgi:arylsulfatase A-like enzyme